MPNELNFIQTPSGTLEIVDADARANKFDKSNIDTSIANPTSDTKVLSEKAVVDNFVNKNQIDTSIANPTSDAKVLSEKAVVNELDKKANKDGNYPTMTVGVADNLAPYSEDSGAEQSKPFIAQGTGTDNNTAIVTTGALGLLKEKQGNTIVANQWVKNGNFASSSNWAASNCSLSVSSNIATILATAQNGLIQQEISIIANHKYIISCEIKLTTATDKVLINITGIGGIAGKNTEETTSWQILTKAFTYASNTTEYLRVIDSRTSDWDAIQVKDVYLIDLTQMFNGNIPQDLLDNPSHFSWHYNGDLSYNIGSLENANGVKLVCTQGRNLWDEEWEEGSISESGANSPSSIQIRSKNYILVIPGTQIYFYIGSNRIGRLVWFDKSKNVVEVTYPYGNEVLNVPDNVYFMRFIIGNGDIPINTYNNDITISLYYTQEQGGEGYNQYYPYVASKVYDTGSEILKSAGDVKNTKAPDGIITRKAGTYTFTGNETLIGQTEIGGYRWVSIPLADCFNIPNTTSKNVIIIGITPTTTYYAGSGCFLFQAELWLGYDKSVYESDSEFLNYLVGKEVVYELATPTTEQGTSFTENLEISDYGMMYWLDGNDNLVGIPQGAKFFYPVDYKGFIDDVYSRTNGDAQDIVVQSEISDTALAERGYIKLASISGYDATKTQVLKNVEGTLTWVDEEA